jgi:catechol 2,3-dioxygenase-like lactoylglutathione lyase family enzyme
MFTLSESIVEESMGCFIGSIVVQSPEGHETSAFWRGVLGYVSQPDHPNYLRPPDGSSRPTTRQDHGAAHVHLDSTDRTHLDLWVDDGDSVESEVERLVELGAKRVDWDYPEEAQHVVLADPAGNLFCVCA